MSAKVTTYRLKGITSVARRERFDTWEPKQTANIKARSNFPETARQGFVMGLLGISDVEFFLSKGYEQDQIITVEKCYIPNFVTLRNDLAKRGFGQVEVVHNNIFDTLKDFEDQSISALFLDLFGFSELCPSNSNREKNLNVICQKLADTFHLQVTYEDQRSTSIWMQKAREALIDTDRSKYLFNTCRKRVESRGIKVGMLIDEGYGGLLSNNQTCRMKTTSMVGSIPITG